MALVACLVPILLVVLVGQADPIDQLLVQVATRTGLNLPHSHTLLVWPVGYSVAPMGKHSAVVVPMHQAKKKEIPTAVPPYSLCPVRSSQQVVAVEPGFEHPN